LNEISDLSKDEWERILRYHTVLNVAASSSQLSDGQVITTASGDQITVLIEDSGTINIADGTNRPGGVTNPNVTAENGIIHIINKVLISEPTSGEPEAKSVYELASSDSDFEMLTEAIDRADMVDFFSNEDPITVFAPNDHAFEAFLYERGAEQISDLSGDELERTLLYHTVTNVAASSSELSDGQVITTASGNPITVLVESSGTINIADATNRPGGVSKPNVTAKNGIIHAINKVLISDPNIVEVITTTPGLESFSAALKQASLVGFLAGTGPFTVFAPTNAALEAAIGVFGYDDFDAFMEAVPIENIQDILHYHIIEGEAIQSDELSDGQELETVNGQSLTIKIEDGRIEVRDVSETDAEVVDGDINATNGVVHIIDKVRIPTLE